MMNYTIEFSGSGEVSEGSFANDTMAIKWVESVLEARGFDAAESVSGDWDQAGQNDDGDQCWRMLFWTSEDDANNDSGARAYCQLCVVR